MQVATVTPWWPPTARTVRPEKPEDRAGRHREVDAGEANDDTEALLEVLYEDRIVGHGNQRRTHARTKYTPAVVVGPERAVDAGLWPDADG
jgi:hypothetical protein